MAELAAAEAKLAAAEAKVMLIRQRQEAERDMHRARERLKAISAQIGSQADVPTLPNRSSIRHPNTQPSRTRYPTVPNRASLPPLPGSGQDTYRVYVWDHAGKMQPYGPFQRRFPDTEVYELMKRIATRTNGNRIRYSRHRFAATFKLRVLETKAAVPADCKLIWFAEWHLEVMGGLRG